MRPDTLGPPLGGPLGEIFPFPFLGPRGILLAKIIQRLLKGPTQPRNPQANTFNVPNPTGSQRSRSEALSSPTPTETERGRNNRYVMVSPSSPNYKLESNVTQKPYSNAFKAPKLKKP